MRLLVGDGAMLNPAWDHEEIPRPERDVPVAHLDRDATLEDEKEVVRLVVGVPDELALHLDDKKIVAVELANDARLPVTVEGRELL